MSLGTPSGINQYNSSVCPPCCVDTNWGRGGQRQVSHGAQVSEQLGQLRDDKRRRAESSEEAEQSHNRRKQTTLICVAVTGYHGLVFFYVLVPFLEALGHDLLFHLFFLFLLLLLLLLPQALFDFVGKCFSGWLFDFCLLRLLFVGRKPFDRKPVGDHI